MKSIVQVALPLPLFRTFSYAVPDPLSQDLQLGSTVEVDFHNRIMTGWVVEWGGEEVEGLKEIRAVEPLPPLPPPFLAFLRRLSVLYLVPLGEVIASSVPPSRKSYRRYLSLRVFEGENISTFREQLGSLPPGGINGFLFRERCGISGSDWEKFLKTGVLRVEPERWPFAESSSFSSSLSFWEIPRTKEREIFTARMLRKAQEEGKKVLFLFPDFEQEDAFLDFLKTLLSPSSIVRYDSRLGTRERLGAFLRVVEGDFEVVVGTRMAAFVFPHRDLQVFVLFDPEEKGYFPDRTPRCNIAEVLEERVRFLGGHLHIVGAVPPLRVYFGWTKKAVDVKGTSSASQAAGNIRGVVVQRRWRKYSLFPPTRFLIAKTVQEGGVVLVWVQKTGYATALGCQECGFYYTCPSCGIALRYHRDFTLLVCPICHFQKVPESVCPSCGGINWEEWGQGIEKVFEEVERAFPWVWKERVDPESDEEGWRGEIRAPSILVGTSALLRESILERASLFVVHSLDEWLSLPEVGAREEFYLRLQKIVRLLPREAQVVVQGSQRSLAQLHEFLKPWSSFYAASLEKRRILLYPPFVRLFRIVVRARNKAVALQVLKSVKDLFVAQGIQVLGPFSSVRPRKERARSAELVIRYADEDAEKVFALCAQAFPRSGAEWSFELVFP